MDADPYTGSAIYLTDLTAGDTHPVEETYGGTSLASPLFTAMMALVNQQRAAEGKSPAGLAAQDLYNQGVYGTSALHDVSGTVPSFAQNGLFFGRPSTGGIYTIFFNQDTSLAARTGWDNVTGVGTPNGQSFIMAMAGQ
jgi:subtilase family serine protease